MRYINVESDFKLLESFDCNCEVNLRDSEFEFEYYTKKHSDNRITVSYKDGKCSTTCKFTDDNRLIVLFENHNLEPGTLKVKRYFNLNDADFSDKTCDFVIEEELPISLTKGIQPCTEECCYVDVKLPPYYQKGDIGPVGPKGDKGDQGDKGDKGDLTVTGITPHNNLLDNTAFNQFDYEGNLLYWNIGGDAETEIHGGDSGIGNNALLIKSYEDPAGNTVNPSAKCLNGVGYVLSLYTKAYKDNEGSTLLINIPNLQRGIFYVDGQQGKLNNLGYISLEQSTNWEKHYIAFAVTRESPIFFAAPSTANGGVLIAQVKLESNPINDLLDLGNIVPTPWTLSANDLKGRDIYELLVESNKFEGTREEFEDEYTDSIKAVKNATKQAIIEANNAQRISQQVQQVERDIIQRDYERSDAFDLAQSNRQQTYEDAENIRNSEYRKAESSRNSGFGSAENTRNNIFLQYESTRQNNETLRTKAEEDRKKAESDRQALFQSNEESRQNTFNTNETTRQNNESIRQTKEAERETKEAKRQSIFSTNEAERKQIFETNEAIREENEAKRVDAEISREERTAEAIASIANKVDRDDNAPKLTAGFANNLVGRGEATPQEISFRPSGGDTSIEDGTARIDRVKGSTVVWNQLIDIDIFNNSSATNGITANVEDGKIVLVGAPITEGTAICYFKFGYVANHVYLMDAMVNGINYSNISIVLTDGTTSGGGQPYKGLDRMSFVYRPVMTNSSDNNRIVAYTKDYVDCNITIRIYDLTQMFGAGNEPTNIEEFNARKPIGIDEYAYNEGEIISTNVEELKSVGFNAWDEEWETGMILGQNGSDQGGSNQIRGKGYIRIAPSTTYEILCKSNKTQGFIVVGYDEDFRYTGWLRYGGNYGAFTTRENDRYIRFCTYAVNYGAVYNHDICIHLAHTGYRNGEYEPYKEFRRGIPIKDIKDKDGNQLFPNGLLSAGGVYDEITATKAIKRIGVVDMGTLNWAKSSLYKNGYYAKVERKVDRVVGKCHIICSKYNAINSGAAINSDYIIVEGFYGSIKDVLVTDSLYTDAATFTAAMSGVMLYYELAEPIEVDLGEPLNLDYEVSDFGTEEVLSSEPTTPMKADIIYQFNAVDRIRDNSRHTAEAAGLLNAKADKTAVEAAINELTNAIPEVVNDLTTGGADKALSAEMGKVIAGKVDVQHQEISMGLVIEDIFPSISDTFVRLKYPMFSGGHINTAGSTNTIGYYLLSGELLQECYSIKALLQCDGASPAAIAFYSSDNDFRAGTYLGGVQHKKTKGEWFEAEIPSEAKACLITNRKTGTNGSDPVILGLKKEKLLSEIVNIKKETEGPDRYQEEHLGDIVLSPTTTTGSIKIDCSYGDIIKVVADANVKSFFLGTKSYGREILSSVSGNQTLYIVLKEKVVNLFAYSAVNNSLQRTISVYKCAKKGLYEYPNLVGSFFRYYTPTIGKNDWIIGKTTGADGTISTSHKRATTGVLDLKNPSIRVSVSDTVNFRFYILSYLKGGTQDHGWNTSYETNIECESLAITIERTDGKSITEDDLDVISVEFLEPLIENYVGEKDFKELSSRVEELGKQNEFSPIGSVNNILNVTKPYYYHFKPDSFITDGDGKKAIPSQTSYDIELASRLGFTSIEANIHATSDGNFICMHGSAGNFGSTVLSLDGSDISATSIGTKTLQWIKNNVRFKSDYEKYKVAPLSLEEFCSCCRSNGIGIFAGTDNTDAINTCVRMLGTDNVMLYGAGANKRSIFKGMMFVWVNSASTTIDNILNTARSYGLPFMYGLGPSLLSALVANNQLSELCSKMHAEGFTLASTAVYDTDENTLNAFNQGVDFSASGHQVNNFEPNYFVHSLDDDTSISGTATINDGSAIMSSGQTIICGKEDKIIGKAILNIRYSGKLTINFGSAGNRIITSDGSADIVLSDYFFKKSSTLTITAESDTTITNLVYKASVC